MLGMTQRIYACNFTLAFVTRNLITDKELREAYHQQDIKGMLTYRYNINAFSIAD